MKAFERTIKIEVVYGDDLDEAEMEQDVWDAVRYGLFNKSKCVDYDITIVEN